MLRNNNFDFVRLVGATGVLVSHGYYIWSKVPDPLQSVTGVTIGNLSVFVFFLTSGFLVAKSWEADPNLFRYTTRRALRICPALYLNIVLSVVISGLFLTTVPALQYWTSPDTWSVFEGFGIFWVQGSMPGVAFPSSPAPAAFNGPLWSIRCEAACYILLAALGLIGAMRSRFLLTAIAATITIANAVVAQDVSRYISIGFMHIALPEMLGVAAFFFMGSALYAWRDSIEWNVPVSAVTLVGLFLLGYFMPSWRVETAWVLRIVLVPALSYAVISFALRPLPVVQHAGRYGDFSYGIYLYAWPVQQILKTYMSPSISLHAYNATCLLFATALAAISWFAVEKPALGFKPKARAAEPAPLPAMEPQTA